MEQPRTVNRLVYDGIPLLPVDRDVPVSKALWHVPGGTRATTQELIDRANKRGVQVDLVTTKGMDSRTESLN